MTALQKKSHRAFHMLGQIADEKPVGLLVDRHVGQTRRYRAPVPIPDRRVDPPDHLTIAQTDVPQVSRFEDERQRPGPQGPGLRWQSNDLRQG